MMVPTTYFPIVGVTGGIFAGFHDKHVQADEDKCADGTNSCFFSPVLASKTINLPSLVVKAKFVPPLGE
jgi:hypothetical protein